MGKLVTALIQSLLGFFWKKGEDKKKKEDEYEARARKESMGSIGESLDLEDRIEDKQDAVKEDDIKDEEGGVNLDNWNSGG